MTTPASQRRGGDILAKHRQAINNTKAAYRRAERKAVAAQKAADGLQAADVLVLLALTEMMPGGKVDWKTDHKKAPTIDALAKKTGYGTTTVSDSLSRMQTQLDLVRTRHIPTWGTTEVASLTQNGQKLLDSLFPPRP